MRYYSYKNLEEEIQKISNIDAIKVIDVEEKDCISEFFLDYIVEQNDGEYYTIFAGIDENLYSNILMKLEKTDIEEIELYNGKQKKYYINFCEKIIQIYDN